MKMLKPPPMSDPSGSSPRSVEALYETGELRLRFAQKRNADGSGWLREGPFEEYYRNGCPAARGFYLNGAENGRWTYYHENGEVAAEGYYRNGRKTGTWNYYDERGRRTDTQGGKSCGAGEEKI